MFTKIFKTFPRCAPSLLTTFSAWGIIDTMRTFEVTAGDQNVTFQPYDGTEAIVRFTVFSIGAALGLVGIFAGCMCRNKPLNQIDTIEQGRNNATPTSPLIQPQ